MSENFLYEEGERCPVEGCNGYLEFPPSEDCHCHICAPCSSCTNSELECSECGWILEDGIEKPENAVYPDEDFFDPDWRV